MSAAVTKRSVPSLAHALTRNSASWGLRSLTWDDGWPEVAARVRAILLARQAPRSTIDDAVQVAAERA